MIQYLKKRKAFVFFNSNGILLDKRCQNQLIDTGLDELRISLDAASPEGYKTIRDSDKFNLIISNVQAFSKRIKSLHVSHPKLSLWYLGTRDNISELPSFVRLADGLGITEVYLQRLVYFQDHEGYGLARSEKTLMDSNAVITELINESSQIAKLQDDLVFNSMLPGSATRLIVCKKVSKILCRGNDATGQQLSCTLPPTAMFFHAAFLPSLSLIMILSFWATFLIILYPKFGRVINTGLSEKNDKLKIHQNAVKVAASSGAFEWINRWKSYW